MSATVLGKKQQHSLKGKNGTMAMMKRFKDLNLPSPRKDFSHARLMHKKKTEDLSTYELKMGFSTLTGETAEDYCDILSVTVSENNLRQCYSDG